ncbi:MAG: hypothetical protein WCK27_17485 [Verrucomicrobiota bacterium]
MKLTAQTKHLVRKTQSLLLALAAALGLPSLSQAAPGGDQDWTLDHPRVRKALRLHASVTPSLMNEPGILGTAVEIDDSQSPGLVIYVDRDHSNAGQITHSLPSLINGTHVRVHLTDKFRAFAGNTARQIAPIQLGTSGGWYYDLANGYCCAGTLGALIQVNGVRYILSNYHVLEQDIVAGGNKLIATTGNPIIQPGLIDVGCSAAKSQVVGTLVKLSSLPGSNVDAAVALASAGMVNTNGSILGIGTISASTVAAKLNQAVKKSGRTTGLTTSTVSGLNATISVAFSSECGGGVAFTNTFTGQIVLANSNYSFLNSGDSGSLLVENVSTNPRAIGLLVAGSSTSAIANPIGEVLQFLGRKLGATATMVGK